MENEQITVTSPLLPDLDELNEYLRDIWSRKWITNNGHYHKELEKALCEYLRVPYISLFTNGTLPLITALQALRITGEVITTPFSFVATTHAIWWNGIKPVFVDIDPSNCGMDPDKIEAANDAFNEIYAKRAAEDRQRVFSVGMKELRGRADDAFDALAKAINALYLVNEMTTKDEGKSTALAALIDDVNTYVVRLRKTMGGTASSSGTEGEEGGSTPTDPTNPDPSEPGGEEPGGEETDSPSGI